LEIEQKSAVLNSTLKKETEPPILLASIVALGWRQPMCIAVTNTRLVSYEHKQTQLSIG